MQTIGERLEDARKQKGISIREAAESTKIRGEYLQKFESNHFDIDLSKIYVRGFLRTYANFLKLPADRLLNDYAALGDDEPRVRQPSREVYGRMDLSVASAAERVATSPDDTAAEAQRAQAKYSRGRSNLPAEPMFDPALVLKVGKIAAAVVVLALLVWGVKSLFSGGPSSRESVSAAPKTNPVVYTPPAPGERYITLIPLDTVWVRVLRRNPDDSEGTEFFNGTLTRGQNTPVPWPVPSPSARDRDTIFLRADPGENLMIESKGQRYPSGLIGNGQRAKM